MDDELTKQLARLGLCNKCSYESIHNDMDEPMLVWWQLADGSPPPGGYLYQQLDSQLTTTKPISPSLEHQVCTMFTHINHWKVCVTTFSPPAAQERLTISVADLLIEGSVSESKLSAVQVRQSIIVCSISVLFVLVSSLFIFVMRRFKRPLGGGQECLMRT
eukprot:gnl/TRDRNA2_/TRDRNA2_80488_c0_seq1.p1 gnl/TRDRNA2_/TRDRNA2_80488_c0~~gnl/TRDRNA2_/TRDRNA2_80488_c0_seq1.p1  ORF type:complete len:161 (+),score=18.84 gnl/TRDRNA2_/TRDRNA2_80488_c0_seq1:55-537(+)